MLPNRLLLGAAACLFLGLGPPANAGWFAPLAPSLNGGVSVDYGPKGNAAIEQYDRKVIRCTLPGMFDGIPNPGGFAAYTIYLLYPEGVSPEGNEKPDKVLVAPQPARVLGEAVETTLSDQGEYFTLGDWMNDVRSRNVSYIKHRRKLIGFTYYGQDLTYNCTERVEPGRVREYSPYPNPGEP